MRARSFYAVHHSSGATRSFLEQVRQGESVQAFIDGANAEQANSNYCHLSAKKRDFRSARKSYCTKKVHESQP